VTRILGIVKRVSLFARDLREKRDRSEVSSSRVASVSHVEASAVCRSPLASREGAYLTEIFSAYLTISIGWKTGSCDPLEDSASTRCRKGAGPVIGA
jgi:hypothetical protein